MKILLTGSGGMVGKNILESPHADKHDFLTPTSKELNLQVKDKVDLYLKANQVDFVIHAAGIVGGIQANMAMPVRFLVDNLQMGLNIILASKNAGIRGFINLSSSCMYPRNASNPMGEELILKGELEPTNEGYALAKIATTRLCEYINREDVQYLYKTVIPCNLYGRHDKFDPKYSHMIPAVIKKISDAKQLGIKSVDIWGNGKAKREFMYAGDLANFIFYAIDHFDKMPQNINVGLGYDYTINEYYQAIAKVIGFDGKFEHDLTKPIGMKQKLTDNSKLKNFGWKHTIGLMEGIEKTYEFYLKNHQKDIY